MFLFPPCLLWFVPPSSLPLQPRAMAGYPLWVLIPPPKLLPITELINVSKSSISASKQLLLHVFIKRTVLFDSCHQLTGHQPTCQSLTIFRKFSVICSAIFHPTSKLYYPLSVKMANQISWLRSSLAFFLPNKLVHSAEATHHMTTPQGSKIRSLSPIFAHLKNKNKF